MDEIGWADRLPGRSSMRKKVLFIAHNAWPTGAPIVLLHLVRWLKQHSDIPFRILLKESGGELEPQFAALAPTAVFQRVDAEERTFLTRIKRVVGLEGVANALRLRALRRRLRAENVRLIYSNTLENGDVLDYLSSLACPVITHVHELDYWMRYCMSERNLANALSLTRHYIAVSRAVRDNLVNNYDIPQSRIELCAFVPLAADRVERAERRQRIREQLGLPGSARVILAAGTTDWRKGPDLFIQLARSVCQRAPHLDAYFVWVGWPPAEPAMGALLHDVKKAGVLERVRFTGHVKDPTPYFAAADMLALVSREDPYPLVVLEAAAVGTPCVCFDGAGGAPEFVEDDCGRVVPYLDVPAFAEAVVGLLEDEALRRACGRRAAEKVRERHDLDAVAPRILRLIRRFLEQNSCVGGVGGD